MKAVLFSLLLLVVIFAVTPANTEDTDETLTQCQQMLRDKEIMIFNIIKEASSTCVVSCSSTCKSLLNNLKSDIGCCLESYGDSDSVDTLLEFCDIPPPCSGHASSVIITFSTIAIFSIIAYFANHV